MASVLSVPGIQYLSGSELRALDQAARVLNVPVDWLATIISFETAGSFDPAQPNRTGSRAFGLIQFLPSTAQNILGGSSTEAAERGKEMSFTEQLKAMVIPYFKSFGLEFESLQDLYLAVFYPKAIHRNDSFVVASQGEAAYEQNKGFDKTGKGFITKADVTSGIVRHYNSTDARTPIPSGWFQIVAGLGIAGALLYASERFLPPEYRLPVTATTKDVAQKGKKWLARNIKAFSS